MIVRRTALLALLGLAPIAPAALAAPAGSPPPHAEAATVTGSWSGKLTAGFVSLRLVLHVRRLPDGSLAATMDSPDQGQLGLPFDRATLEDGLLTLHSDKLQGGFSGRLKEGALEGEWRQGAFKAPLTLARGEAAALRKPQEPQPPYPYEAVEVSYPNPAGRVSLAGTLTTPRGKGPFPALLLIAGSGQQDRDSTLFGHKPFKLWADALTRRGFAVLRVDERGLGGSTGDFASATTADLASDVKAGLAFLKSRPGIDAGRLGLVGHSEGGLIAAMAGAETPELAFVVLLAAPGLPGDRIVEEQVRALSRAGGLDAPQVEQAVALQRRLLQVAKSDAPAAEARRDLLRLLVPAGASAEQRAQGEAAADQLLSPWYRFYLRTDPRPYLAKLSCPVLAVNGERDLQVAAAPNLEAIGAAVGARLTPVALPRLNHLLQTAVTGLPQEYGQLAETIAPEALAVVGEWLSRQAEARR